MRNYSSKFLLVFMAMILFNRIAFAEQGQAERALNSEYCFAFLGDFHFDRLHHHDMNWVKEKHPGDVRQIENYSQVTEQNSRGLLEATFNSLKSQILPMFAIIQAGDFVEGLCGSYDLQALQFREAISFVERSVPSVPFLITKGNHDITGPDADRAYADIILPWLGKQLDTVISGTSYYVEHNSDLFIFFDAYNPDLDWLEEVLSQRPVRHVFFMIHQPVVPYNARAKWHIFSTHEKQAQRDKLLDLLGRYQAIVLSGHLHHYSVLRRKTDNGVFVQLAMNSVIDIDEKKVNLLEGVDMYTPDLVDLEGEFDAKTKYARRDILSKEKPSISYFELAKAAGYFLVTVSDNAVDIDVRLRNSRSTWRHLQIEKSTLDIKVISEKSQSQLQPKGVSVISLLP